MASLAVNRQNGAGDFAQAALGAVSGNRVANFLRASIPDPYARNIRLGAFEHLQNKSGHGHAFCPRRALEIAALGQNGELPT